MCMDERKIKKQPILHIENTIEPIELSISYMLSVYTGSQDYVKKHFNFSLSCKFF